MSRVVERPGNQGGVEVQFRYWKQKLRRPLAVLQLPRSRQSSVEQDSRSETRSFELPSPLSEAIRALVEREGLALRFTLLAAFKIMLHYYTGQHDLLVRMPVLGRNLIGLEGSGEFFLNSVVVRTDLSGNPEFREVLRQVHDVTLEAYSYKDFPYEELVRQLQVDEDLPNNPLSQAMFVFKNAPKQFLGIGGLMGLTLTQADVDRWMSRCILALYTEDTGRTLSGTLEYDATLVDAATANSMADQYPVLLESITVDPELHVSDLSLPL
jgi:non-ribosomal peptide synthetase component F